MIVLTLPYPISANRYWRTRVIGQHATTYVSTEAKDFIEQVGWICRAAGIKGPLLGRLAVHVQLFPRRPLDWQKRMKKLGATWDDSVQCMDLTNCEKVLLDAMNTIVFEDDKQVWRYSAERMEPDEKGARVEIAIDAVAVAEMVRPAELFA
jgi:crossover junction endodeoxyribonuclease RusA